MAVIVTDPHTIALNDKLYKIDGTVSKQMLSEFPDRFTTGDPSYDSMKYLSSLILNDQRGGLGVENYLGTADINKFWWSNLILDYPDHFLLPRLATSITVPADSTLTNADFEATGTWTGGARSNTQAHGGTYSWALATGENTYQDASNWTNTYRGLSVKVSVWVKVGVAAGTCTLTINDGIGTTTASTGTMANWEQLSVTRVLNAAATKIRVQLDYADGGANISYWDDLTTCVSSSGATVTVVGGTFKRFCNFNGNTYMAKGNALYKINTSTGASLTLVWISAAAIITDLISSLNTKMYVYLGDSVNYYYMTTAEAFTQSNSAVANWGFQWDGKLFKVATTGACAYSVDPDAGGPTWTASGSLADVKSIIERFYIGRNSSGDNVACCSTHEQLKVLNFTAGVWDDTELKLSNHPNGGKGATYWGHGHYVSSGLGVKFLKSGEIDDVGMDVRDGLPVEYNGEITCLSGDSAFNVLFASVDASQVTGTAKSGLYAYNGVGWHCWWIDTANDGVMYDIIISSAYGYRVWWDCGGAVYYIDIPRGIANPKQITQNYAASGSWYSYWFDCGTQAFNKMLARLKTFAKSVTTSETVAIKYRTNKTNTDLATGWTTLDTLNTTGENGINIEKFASGVGESYQTVQLAMDFARGATTTLSPDVQSIVLASMKTTNPVWAWTFTVVGSPDNSIDWKQIEANLKTCAESGTLLKFIYREDDTNETEYVKVLSFKADNETGRKFEGRYLVSVIDPISDGA